MNYDIRSVAVSDANTGIVYILTGTFDTNWKMHWKLYGTTVEALMALPSGTTISNAGFGSPKAFGTEDDGFCWEIIFENGPGNGRIWIVKGTPIEAHNASNYTLIAPFPAGTLYGDPDPDTEFVYNVNSADLVGEMIYQFNKGASIKTNLKHSQAAKDAAAAAATSVLVAGASADEIEEEEE
jgi:hypothetical protein